MSKKKKDKKKFTGQVSLTRARKIFQALGFKTAGNWNEVRLTKKIQNLPDLAEGAKLDDKMQKRVNTICNAIKAGKKVVVINLEDVAVDKKRASYVEETVKRDTEKKKEKKAAKEKKTKKKSTTTKKAKTAGKTGIDKFGSRIGSDTSKINASLSKKPKKMSQLMEDAGVEGTHYTHLNKLIKAGYVKKSDKGFVLAS